ncbi:Immunity protein 43 [Paenibacillus algorifonticola]|uniref:Immunity protein 43 n=1 Tax=Paenibacillus algorifonticola TaxID=684063 RepID=A0A1I2CDN3_9BACL|nr:Imm43 family immunity protein [Paenibacillus algorifonticola]SFE66467.1 Immunity protein 43 [Paenibacillus algorifonticola]
MITKKLYVIEQKSDKGIPILLNGVLAEGFNVKNPMPEMDYDWCRKAVKEAEIDFPEKLFLICKEKWLIFDYIVFFRGFIISEEFLKLFRTYSSMEGFQLVPLETKSWKGEKNTDKQYYYLFPYKKEKWVDYEESKYLVMHGKTKEDVISKNGLFVQKFETIILKDSEVNKEVFTLKGSRLERCLFCSDDFKEGVEKENLVGIEFISIEDFPAHYNKKNLL